MCSLNTSFGWEKMPLKQSNGLISVIQTLLHQQQWFGDSMLILKMVADTNNTKYSDSSNSIVVTEKHQKSLKNHFGQS